MALSANVLPVWIIPYIYFSFRIFVNLCTDNANRDHSSPLFYFRMIPNIGMAAAINTVVETIVPPRSVEW
jgi:hypothetical protein